MANAIEDGEVINQKIFIRGNPKDLGEIAPKGFPKIFGSENVSINILKGSGRLQLARWLTQPDHPLPARVIVNRVWQWYFGQGLVRTPDNWGTKGENPTHPQLLDYLARRFTENGWSLKYLHRLIMGSSVYQMSSLPPGQSVETDPRNLLLSRFPRRRLDIEEIRDSMLALDGSLDLKMGGTLQTGTGFQPENSSERLSLDPEIFLLRTVYLPLRRANLPPLLRLFDFGDATTSSGKRLQTNVAPQALFMLNSEFVDKRSRNLVKLLFGPGFSTHRERLENVYLRTLSRYPNTEELNLALSYINGFLQKSDAFENNLDNWQSYCRILLSSNEFNGVSTGLR